MLMYIVWKVTENEFSFTLSKFYYIFCVYVLYGQCCKLPFSMKHSKWQLRLSDN